MEQLELFDQMNSHSYQGVHHAKIFQWPEKEPRTTPLATSAEAVAAPHYVGLGSTLSAISNLGGSYGKTCQDVSLLANPSTEATSLNSRLKLRNSGIVAHGELLTFSTPEWTHFQEPSHSVGGVCGLSDILETMETEADWERLRKYFLSARACSGILRRAAARGKELPIALKDALTEQIRMWESGELEGEGCGLDKMLPEGVDGDSVGVGELWKDADLEHKEAGVIDETDEFTEEDCDDERDEGCLPDGGLPTRGGGE